MCIGQRELRIGGKRLFEQRNCLRQFRCGQNILIVGLVEVRHVARTEIRNAPPGSIDGDGMAVAGLILGYLHLALIAMFLLLVFTVLGGVAFFTHFFH